MSIVGSIGLATARELERLAPAGVALRAYRALLANGDARVRAEALLGALRSALVLVDEAELDALGAHWENESDVASGAGLLDLALELAGRGRVHRARALVAAEVARKPLPRARYVLARLFEREGAEELALAQYAAALACAGAHHAIAHAARARLLEAALARGAPYAEIEAHVVAFDAAGPALGPYERLMCAEARLRAPSKYLRASGFSALADVARGGDAALARRALLAVARRVDELGPELSAVEAERARVALECWPDAAARAQAVAELARHGSSGGALAPASGAADPSNPGVARYHELARALLAGRPVVLDALEDAPRPSLALAGVALNALAALALGDPARALRALRHAVTLLDAVFVPPPALYAALHAALIHEDEEVQRAGARLAAHLLSPPRGVPPRGFLPYARALAAAGDAALSLALLRAAAGRDEPGAALELGAELRARGYRAAATGDPHEAVRALREARALFGAAGARSPA